VQLDIANARFRERRTERAFVTSGRLHADKRRPRPRDPRRKGLRGVGDPSDMPRPREANVDPGLRNIHPDKNFAAIALHRAPGRSENKSLGRTPDCIRASKAQTTVRVSDRDAGGSEMATVFEDQSTIGAPAGVPILNQRWDPNNAIHEDVPQIMVDHITRLYGWFCAIDWKPEAITAAATVLLAFLTLTLAGGTIGLWFATRRLVRGAENTAERQLRAYIFVSDSSRVGGPSPAPEFRIVVKNFGQTPARNGTYWVSSKIDKYNSTAGFDRPKDAGTGRFESGPFHVSTVTGINVEPGKLRLEGDA
jgi:hypothetical protein